MKRVFADTQHFVALINPNDQGHLKAQTVSQSLGGVVLLTTEEVLIEVLTYFGGRGRYLRTLAAIYGDDIMADPEVVVLAQSHESFMEGFALYKARPDEGYSLTDCISMTTMHRGGITEILTHDGHFAQEGFRLLV